MSTVTKTDIQSVGEYALMEPIPNNVALTCHWLIANAAKVAAVDEVIAHLKDGVMDRRCPSHLTLTEWKERTAEIRQLLIKIGAAKDELSFV